MSVPKLRFKEFTGNWEVKKLEKLLLFKNGINATKEQYGKGVKFINVMDIINNDFIFHDNIIGCVDITQKVFEDSKVEYGDVLFQRSSETREEVGQASVYLDKDKSATFGGFVIRGKKISEYDPVFMNFLLKTDLVRKDITDKSGGSTRYNVGQETLKTVAIHLPSIPEQTKIANFLVAINEKIAQLTQKCELLARYKKGVMQQIFSQELRFKDDGDRDFPDWEEKRLDDIADIKGGKRLPKGVSLQIEKNQFPYITVSDMYQGGVDTKNIKYVPSNVVDIIKNYKISRKDIFISVAGTLGIVGIIPEELEGANLTENANKITNLKCDQQYLFQYFLSEKLANLIENVSTVGAQPKLAIYALNSFQVDLPSVQEQIKIANFLTSIDKKITETQTYLDIVKQYKQGLLQQMFV